MYAEACQLSQAGWLGMDFPLRQPPVCPQALSADTCTLPTLPQELPGACMPTDTQVAPVIMHDFAFSLAQISAESGGLLWTAENIGRLC